MAPLVNSRHMTRGDGRAFNPFAEQIGYSLQSRLYDSGYPTVMLYEQPRMAGKLSNIPSELQYGGQITNASSTQMSNRPIARRAVDFLKTRYHLETEIPQIFLHVPSGVCFPHESSYINPHNTVAGMYIIYELITYGIFKVY